MNSKEIIWFAGLKEVTSIIRGFGLIYFLDCGTLLGAVRDKRFISWDNDIDLGILDVQISSEIKFELIKSFYSKGWNVNHSLTGIYLTRGIEEINICFYKKVDDSYSTYYSRYLTNNHLLIFLNNVKIGSHLYSKGRGKIFKMKEFLIKNKSLLRIVPTALLASFVSEEKFFVKVPLALFDSRVTIPFYGEDFVVPAYEKYLVFRYGQSWNVPKDNYNYLLDDQSLIR